MTELLLCIGMFALTGATLMGFFGVVPQVIAIGVSATPAAATTPKTTAATNSHQGRTNSR